MIKTVTFKVEDLDCASCVINIDGMLEDTEGIKESRTNYAKERTSVTFDPQKIKTEEILKVINKTGYKASIVN